jgi:uncharacterized protein with von Willebrand factor type A (vWA) domain
MERVITRFVTTLRKEGIRVSPGESLDAVHALAFGGMDSRETMRAALRLTLVKNSNDFGKFDEVFDWFFTRDQLNPQGYQMDDFLGALIHIVDGEQLKSDEHRTRERDDPLFMVDDELTEEDLKNLMGMEESDDDAGGADLMVQLDGNRDKKKEAAPSDFYMKSPTTTAYNPNQTTRKEAPFTPEELSDMQEVVYRMLMRIRKDVRRMKELENRGKLHVIKTIQKNYKHGMVPFLLSLRRKRKEKPRLVVFCDLSYSVSHATRFMLLLLHTLQNRLMHVRSFVFNSEIVEITDRLRNMPVNCLLETIDKGDIVNLDDNSDFGNVFKTFKEKYLENLQGKPAVIIMGDGRNNYNDANEWALEELREKAGYMLWLTPEDRETWVRGDCLMELYGAYCDRVEVVKDVDELSRIVEDLFSTLYDHLDSRTWRRKRPEWQEEEPYDYRAYYNLGHTAGPPAFDPEVRRQW